MLIRLISWFFAIMSTHSVALSAAAPAKPSDAAPASRALLIVHAAHLAEAAQEWSHYRTSTGWNVTLLSVAPIAPDESSEARANELLRRISNAWGDALAGGATEFAVLLLGDADGSGIPTFRFLQHDPDLKTHRDTHFVSDHPYRAGSVTRDQPRFPLGRIPARTLDEARIALAKIKAYETGAQPALWQRRINCLAGEGHFGPLDVLLETVFTAMVDSLVPPSFDMSMTYAKATSMYCPPIDALTSTILNRLAEDAFLFVYVGHGSPTALDEFHWRGQRRATLSSADLGNLAAVGAHRPIAVLACCSTGWFDLPNGEHSLAEAMLFAPNGPVAVVASSRPTHPYANAVMLGAITRNATAGSARTLGELDMRVAREMLRSPSLRDPIDLVAMPIASAMHWATSLSEHRKMHVRLYNLLGDPCMKLPEAGGDISVEQNGRTVIGTIEGMTAGRVEITIQTSRDKPAQASAMLRVLNENDPELPAKSAINYDIANDRTLATLTADVDDGRFEIELPAAIDKRAAIITMHAVGTDGHGNTTTAHGAVTVQRTRVRRTASPSR
jgi:hypothetical protein